MTGLKVSAIYRQVLDIWRGDADYLSYLKTLASVLPGGGEVAKTIVSAIELTDKARKIAGKVQAGIATAKTAIDTGKKLANGGVQVPSAANAGSVVELANGSGLLNAGSNFARSKMEKQLAFFKDQKELAQTKGAIAESSLMTSTLANVPGVGGGG
jgi:hypothetical protein